MNLIIRIVLGKKQDRRTVAKLFVVKFYRIYTFLGLSFHFDIKKDKKCNGIESLNFNFTIQF